MTRLAAALFLLAATGGSAQEIQLTRVAAGVPQPTDIQTAQDGSGRMFLVQQNGLIRILRNGTVLAQPFLDITSKTQADGERGLLGLAFSPGFAQSGRFYLDYTDLNGDTVIAQYRVSSNPDIADPGSETVLLHIAQPFANHNGGQLRFGPDGYLYIAMGDGGSGGDPLGNGQSLGTLLGKILRVDVESQPGSARIPPSNPFVNTQGARGEIWAYGLRNPWRFSFDRSTGDLWIADVGQDLYEEVDFQPASSAGGENYGWNRMEGFHCFLAAVCDQQGLTLPVVEYPHTQGCAITGGFMYRGAAAPGLRGTYLYSDYCSGTIWGLSRAQNGWATRVLISSGFAVSTFGQDDSGELYVANAKDGTIYRIQGATTSGCVFSLGAANASVGSGSGTTGQPLTGSFVLNAAGCTASDTWMAVSDSPRLLVVSNASGNGSAASTTITYSMYTNSTTLSRTAHINVAGLTFTVSQAGSNENEPQRVVRALYQTILGREPDAAGWAFWTGPGAPKDNSSGATLFNQMADGFYMSPEFRNSGWLVLSLYKAITGSLPTFSQWISAVTQIRNQSMTAGQLANTLGGSVSNSAFVQAAFQNGFGRAPNANELAGNTANLDGGESRIDFLNNVIFSNHEFTDRTNGLLVDALYYTILLRNADSAGSSFWVGQLDPPTGQFGIYYLYSPGTPAYALKLAVIGQAVPPNPALLGFLGSPEFQVLIQ